MQEIVRQDILSVLRSALTAVKSHNMELLKELSDQTLHNASIYQDKDSISIGVLLYALSKTFAQMDEGKVEDQLSRAENSLNRGDLEAYSKRVRELLDDVIKTDKDLNPYIQKVMDQAEIKKGSRMYEHGISLAQSADMLGVSQWEMMKYLGQTKIADSFEEEYPLNERIKHARSLFGL